MKKDIRDLSYPQLTAYLESISEKPFRAKQIFKWIYKKNAVTFEDMTDIPAILRRKLVSEFVLFKPEIVQKRVASDDTQKVVFCLSDGKTIETAVIPAEGRATVCLSTQVGCKFACRFCASGIGGWRRQLTPGEILMQACYAQRVSGDQPLSHVVFMGIGEPFDNYDNVVQAARVINSPEGMNIGARRITVSTCGVVPGIRKFADENWQIELAVSLHAATDELRDEIMPVNKKYPLKELMAACRDYCNRTNRQITFEYILIKDVTCTNEMVAHLAKLFKGLICKMNLIPCNPVPEFDYRAPSEEDVERFVHELKKAGIHATVRTSRGQDIGAACGQLRRTVLNSKQ